MGRTTTMMGEMRICGKMILLLLSMGAAVFVYMVIMNLIKGG